MSSILDLLGSQLDPATLARLGSQVGATPEQTSAAVSAALPAMIGALQRNSSTPQGEAALGSALDRDHDGSILDNLGSLLGGGPSSSDVRSLDHIFGQRRGRVEDAVASRGGLDRGQVVQLLAMLAPLVLGALSRARQHRGAASGGGTSGGGGLGDILGGALGQMRQGGGGGGLGSILGGLLDRDHDGSFLDDLLGGGGQPRAGTAADSGGGILGDLLGGGQRSVREEGEAGGGILGDLLGGRGGRPRG
ncbi:MAG TPA: DUF937 domain-containing protein [Thermoanaerobaculia bacterium]|nr:DUF937 domain-containing protein [Thermoanaerobaculia bacterium]